MLASETQIPNRQAIHRLSFLCRKNRIVLQIFIRINVTNPVSCKNLVINQKTIPTHDQGIKRQRIFCQ